MNGMLGVGGITDPDFARDAPGTNVIAFIDDARAMSLYKFGG